MALSHRPIFPGGLSEEKLVSPMRTGNGCRVEGIPEKSGGDEFGKGWHDVENCFDYGMDRSDRGSTRESVSKDIIDLLPSDPFGMDISTTFTAITGWLEDLEIDYGGNSGGRDELLASCEDYQLFAGFNFNFFWNNWNNAVRFHHFPQWGGGNVCFEERKFQGSNGLGECSRRDVRDSSCSFGSGSACDMDGVLGFGSDYKDVTIASVSGDTNMNDVNSRGGDDFSPHPALGFSLSYLGLSDLLSVERVCKSLHSTVRGDPLLWRSIHIDQPLNDRITDDVLFELTKRAQGNLQCLSLVECSRITDDGLKRVLEVNPKLIKLSVPGCTKLNIEAIVGLIKAYNTIGTQRVKHLYMGSLFGVTQQHFEELKLLLGTNSQLQQHSHKPHFYCRKKLYLSFDDDRDIDIDLCPICQSFKLLYDCPVEGCQEIGDNTSQACRGCIICIPRCSQCGRCIKNSAYEETFCLELLCSCCSRK